MILVSGTNNTITAWQFNGGEVKNVNATKDFILFKDELRIAILIADSPQYSMIWDPQLKQLFTGQKDGRILKWDLTKPNNIAEDTFDIKIVKQKESGPKNSKSQNEREEAKKLKIDNAVFHNDVGYIWDSEHQVIPKGSKGSPSDYGKEGYLYLMKNCVKWI